MDAAPTASPADVPALTRAIVLGNVADASDASFVKSVIIPKGSALPAYAEVPLAFNAEQTEGAVHLFLGSENESTDAAVSANLGGISLIKDIATAETLLLTVTVDETGLTAEVVSVPSKTVVQTLKVALA